MSAGFEIWDNELDEYSGSESEIMIPEGVKIIKQYAFLKRESLKIVHIPSSVKEIEDMAFKGCKALMEFRVDSTNENYSVMDGMLVNKVKDTLVWVPAGKNISEYVIPDNITIISSHAFIDCTSLKKIVIPASVKMIKDEVFPRYDKNDNFSFEEIEVDPKAGSLGIGRQVFDFKDERQPLVYPKLPLSFVKGKVVQARLCLGYCLNPSIYDGEYAEIYQKYAKSLARILLEEADYPIILDILKYYHNVLDTNKLYKGIKSRSAVELLEKVILSGDVEQAKQVIEGCKEFEFGARALGLACLYSSLEMVKVLVEGGLTFNYEYNFTIQHRYGVAYSSINNIYQANYSLLLAKTNVNVWHPVVHASTYSLNFGSFHFDLEIEKPENSQIVRADIVEYLLTQPQTNFDASSTLFYSILWGCSEVAQRLIQNGVKLSEKYIDLLSKSSRAYERTELLSTLSALPASEALSALKSFSLCLDGTQRKIMLTQIVFETDKTSMLDADIVEYIFSQTNTSKISKSKLLAKIIDTEDVKALKVVVNAGAIKTREQREKALAYATKQKKNEALAWLIDYINQNVDVAAEEAKEEAKMLKELMVNPNSVSALKKKYSYKKIEDGTLKITSYKGSELEVEIPARIGKDIVTVIGENAFTTSDEVRNKNENRKNIQKVIIPEGVVKIGWSAFNGCTSLETVVLPTSLKKIGNSAFSCCENLTNINIPEGIEKINSSLFGACKSLETIVLPSSIKKIDDSAFSSCKNLANINIPNGVVEIGRGAFSCCDSLKTIVLPSSLKKIWGSAFSFCENLTTINIPKGVKIDSEVFNGCTKLENKDGMVIIDGVLYKSPSVKEKGVVISIPEGVKKIADNAFSQLFHPIEKIVFPQGLKEIEKYAFYWLHDLKQINIPSSIKEIKKDTFSYTGLEKIEFVEGLKIIGENAFRENDFREIHIPKSVTTIGPRAFFKCVNLKDIYIPASVVNIGEELFGNKDGYTGDYWNSYRPKGIRVHTPKGSVAQEYMKQYSGVQVINDYPQE